ncbi:hypothetical protein AM506_21825, partial [Rossellomorea vietnamensis]
HGLDIGQGGRVGQRLLGAHEGGAGAVQVVVVEVHQAQPLQCHATQEQRTVLEHGIEQALALAMEAALLVEVDQDLEGGLGLFRQPRPVATLEQRLEDLLGAATLAGLGGDQARLEQRLGRGPATRQRRLEGVALPVPQREHPHQVIRHRAGQCHGATAVLGLAAGVAPAGFVTPRARQWLAAEIQARQRRLGPQF